MGFMESGDYLKDSTEQVIRLLVSGVPVLVYNGDFDSMVDWVGSKAWVTQLAWPHQREWALAPDVQFVVPGRAEPGGRVRTSSGLTFMQVYRAGHMVPKDQPEVAL